MPTRLSRMFVHSRVIGVLIIVVLIASFMYSSYTSQQQLQQANHLNQVVKCQTRVNNQFNAVLKYNTRINEEATRLNDKDRTNLSTMVSKVGEGIHNNDNTEIRNAISDYNEKRKELDKQRAKLNRQRAQYPKLPEEQCR